MTVIILDLTWEEYVATPLGALRALALAAMTPEVPLELRQGFWSFTGQVFATDSHMMRFERFPHDTKECIAQLRTRAVEPLLVSSSVLAIKCARCNVMSHCAGG